MLIQCFLFSCSSWIATIHYSHRRRDQLIKVITINLVRRRMSHSTTRTTPWVECITRHHLTPGFLHRQVWRRLRRKRAQRWRRGGSTFPRILNRFRPINWYDNLFQSSHFPLYPYQCVIFHTSYLIVLRRFALRHKLVFKGLSNKNINFNLW